MTVLADIRVDGQRFTSDQRHGWLSNVDYFPSNIQRSAEENPGFDHLMMPFGGAH